jgi:hypothetical protein
MFGVKVYHKGHRGGPRLTADDHDLIPPATQQPRLQIESLGNININKIYGSKIRLVNARVCAR